MKIGTCEADFRHHGGNHYMKLKEYTAKIEEATPTLVEEFKTETSGITDVTKLAEISNAKIQKLAEISTEGIGKMAEIKLVSAH